MRKMTMVAVAVVALGWTGGFEQVVLAEMCAVDAVPAATLLVPYFEVDYLNLGGRNTVVTIRNSSPEPALAHLTLWTDWGAPTLDFDLFLTGYGVETFDLYELFANGTLPITADEQTDPADTISPHGRSEWDGSFPDCDLIFPFFPGIVAGSLLERIQQGHTGGPISGLGGNCLGGVQADGVARGYITVDSVSMCSLLFPSDSGYFMEGGLGVANDDNKLTGEVRLIDSTTGVASSLKVAHIEADPTFEGDSGATFYGRLVGNDGSDDREPLGSVWSVPFSGAGSISRLPPTPPTGTEFLVWRDSGSSEVLPGGATCGVGPAHLPLETTQGVCLGPDNQFDSVCSGAGCFPLALQGLFPSQLGLSFDEGFCQFNLNRACEECLPGGGGSSGTVSQSYVAARTYSTAGLATTDTVSGTLVASACDDLDPTIDLGEVFADGFEEGDTSAWN